MFGGLTFIVNTHMACGIVKDDLMVRVGKDGHVAALARGAHVMDFTGRPMRGMVIVSGSQVVDESALDEWSRSPWSSRGHSHPKANKDT
jgi:hypothetical protein